jgi:hypothetical protein
MYLVNTRPYICFDMNILSQYMMEPKSAHWIGAKHVLRYIAGSVDYGLDYVRGDGVRLIGYTDSDWADVQMTGRAPQGVVLVWDQQLFPSSTENRGQWH